MPVTKNVKVSEKVLNRLKVKKKELGAKTLNEVINILLERDKRDDVHEDG